MSSMAGENENANQPGPEETTASSEPAFSEQDAKRAKNLSRRVFRYVDLSEPPMAAFMELAVVRRAELWPEAAQVLKQEVSFFKDEPKEKPPAPEPTKAVDPDQVAMPDIELPSPPPIYAELQEAIAKDVASAQDLAEIIMKDTALTAKVLKLVNSAFYGLVVKIDTLSRALAIIGIRELTTLSTGIAIMSSFDDIPDEFVDMESFWRHSISVGALARLIAEKAGLPDSERFFVAGLLHDLGRLVMFKGAPDKALKAFARARESYSFLHYAEQEILGYDHSTLGSVILRKWNIPFDLRMAVLYHHSPEVSGRLRENSVVHVANILSRALAYGTSGEIFVDQVNEAAWESLGISEDDIRAIAAKSKEMLEPMFAILIRA